MCKWTKNKQPKVCVHVRHACAPACMYVCVCAHAFVCLYTVHAYLCMCMRRVLISYLRECSCLCLFSVLQWNVGRVHVLSRSVFQSMLTRVRQGPLYPGLLHTPRTVRSTTKGAQSPANKGHSGPLIGPVWSST